METAIVRRVRSVVFSAYSTTQRARLCDITVDGRPQPDHAMKQFVGVNYSGSQSAGELSESRDVSYRFRLTLTQVTSDTAQDQIASQQPTPPRVDLFALRDAVIAALDRVPAVFTNATDGANHIYDPTDTVTPWSAGSRLSFVGDSGNPTISPGDWFMSSDPDAGDVQGLVMTLDFDGARTQETP
jgi:hypothetical protein